jgi:hypothetical protein
MQTRRGSMLETFVNTIVGCLIGFVIVYATMRIDPDPASAAVWIVGLNLPASAMRSYVVRRLFNGVEYL